MLKIANVFIPVLRTSRNIVTMAQFGFENDIHNVLKLDMPITNAPMARWQRKASTSSAKAPLSPGNRSVSSSKTPNKTPGILKNEVILNSIIILKQVSGSFCKRMFVFP